MQSTTGNAGQSRGTWRLILGDQYDVVHEMSDPQLDDTNIWDESGMEGT